MLKMLSKYCKISNLIMKLMLLVVLIDLAASATNDKDLVCSACRIVVRHLHENVENEAAQGRTVETGSFRVDSQGNQRVAKVPYARSDTHLTNALESACEQLQSGWGHAPHPSQPDSRTFVSLTRKDGQSADTSHLTSGSSVDNWLRMRCESLLDDHEDELKALLRQTQPQPLTVEQLEGKFCLDTANVCSTSLLALKFEDPPVAAAPVPPPPIEESKAEETENVAETEAKTEL